MAKIKKTLAKRRPGQPKITQIANTPQAKSEYKMKLAAEQDFICPLCGSDMSKVDTAKIHLDHNHKNGMVRQALCSGCNRFEGKIAGAIKRLLSKVEIDFEQFVRNLIKYWDYHDQNPSYVLHPGYKTKFDKKEKTREKAKKRREKLKNSKN